MLAGADFRSIHQLAPHASTAQCIGYPEVSYEQPPAIGFTCHANQTAKVSCGAAATIAASRAMQAVTIAAEIPSAISRRDTSSARTPTPGPGRGGDCPRPVQSTGEIGRADLLFQPQRGTLAPTFPGFLDRLARFSVSNTVASTKPVPGRATCSL
jgi:hypothetical protein